MNLFDIRSFSNPKAYEKKLNRKARKRNAKVAKWFNQSFVLAFFAKNFATFTVKSLFIGTAHKLLKIKADKFSLSFPFTSKFLLLIGYILQFIKNTITYVNLISNLFNSEFRSRKV